MTPMDTAGLFLYWPSLIFTGIVSRLMVMSSFIGRFPCSSLMQLQFPDNIVYLSVRQSHDSSFPHVYTCMHVCSQYEPAPVPMGMALRTRRMNAMGAMRTGKPALRPFCSQKPLWHGLPAWFISSSVGDRPFRQARRSGNTACRRSGICSSGTERQAYGSGR